MSAHESAAGTAARYVETMRAAEDTLARMEPYAQALFEHQIAVAFGEGHRRERVKVLPPQDRAKLREILFTSQDAVVRRLWQRHRIVYDIDAALWAELGDTDRDTVVPATLMTRLPHPDPFIAMPEPMLIPLSATQRMRVEGFFVVGRGPVQLSVDNDVEMVQQISTHAPHATGEVGLLVGGTVEENSGRSVKVWHGVQDMVWTRVTLDTGHGDVTVGELVDRIAARFDKANYKDAPAGDFDDVVPAVVARAVSALIYLCATNAELRPLPVHTAARQAAKGGKAAKPAKVVQVGFQLGAALRAYRRSEAAEHAASGDTRTVRPHVRRAHFHTFLVGHGRTEKIVKWLSPIPVNVTSDAKQSTVVPVRSLRARS